jgi:hypothetical protein
MRRVLYGLTVAVVFVFIGVVGMNDRVSAHGVTDGRHAFNFSGPNAREWSAAEAELLASRVIETGVQWAFLPIVWEWAETDPPLPYDDGGRWQGPSGNWRRYDFGQVTTIYNTLRQNGVNVVIGMYRHPRWAGGNFECDTENPFTEAVCGRIYDSYKPIFSDGVRDLAFYIALLFPDAAGFTTWNEPNGQAFFRPQPPLHPDILGEYLNLVHWPARDSIRAVIPNATIIGPELATKDNCGSKTETSEWGYPVGDAITNWVGPLLQFFPNDVDVISIHHYGDTWQCTGLYTNSQVARTKTKMNQIGVWKPIWVTETNVGNDMCQQSYIADWWCEVYKDNDWWWQRTFFFTLADGADHPCGRNLLTNDLTPKWLHTAFHAIVDRNYYCYAHGGPTW